MANYHLKQFKKEKNKKRCFLLHKKSDHVTSLLETFQLFPFALGIKSKSNMSHNLNLIRGREHVSVSSSRPILCGSQDMVASFIINLISLCVIYMPQRGVINLNEYLAKKKINTKTQKNSLPSFFPFIILFCFPTPTPFLLSSRKRQTNEKKSLCHLFMSDFCWKNMIFWTLMYLICLVFLIRCFGKGRDFLQVICSFVPQGCFLHRQCCVFWWEGLVCSCLQNTEFNCLVIAVVQSYSVPVSLTSSVNSPVSFLVGSEMIASYPKPHLPLL